MSGSGDGARRRARPLLFSDPVGIDSHRVRLMLAEKGVPHDTIDVAPGERNERLLEHNPLGSRPVLVDRELALYDADVVIEYLDERHPHPPMMPVDPVGRARTRLALFRIRHDWQRLLVDALADDGDARRELLRSLSESAPLFSARRFFLSDTVSVLDVSLAPLLWRLTRYGIVPPDEAAAITAYAERLFARPAFESSLSAAERDMGSRTAVPPAHDGVREPTDSTGREMGRDTERAR